MNIFHEKKKTKIWLMILSVVSSQGWKLYKNFVTSNKKICQNSSRKDRGLATKKITLFEALKKSPKNVNTKKITLFFLRLSLLNWTVGAFSGELSLRYLKCLDGNFLLLDWFLLSPTNSKFAQRALSISREYTILQIYMRFGEF